MLAARADVARDLRQLLGGHEHAIVALVFEIEVVARDIRDGARLKAGEARDAVILVHDDVPGAQLRERAQRAAAHAARAAAPWPAPAPPALRALGAATAQQTVLGEDRELQLGRDEALAQRGGGEAQRRLEHLARRRPRPRPARSAFRRPRL